MRSLLVLCVVLSVPAAHAGELYRTIDRDGNVQYSDQYDSAARRLKLGNEPVVVESLPFSTQKAMEFFPVTLYTFEQCGAPCKDAKALLVTRGIPFTEKSLTTQADLDEFRKAAGTDQAPAMLVGKTWVRGFLATEWHKELDFAGYPKTAPYRPKPAAAQ